MGLSNCKQLTLTLPAQAYLSHFSVVSLVYLFVVSMFFSGTVLGQVSIYLMYL